MAEIVVMPKMNLAMEEGTIGQWYKSAGDAVEADDPLCDVENEKEVGDVLAPCAGVLLRVWGESGEKYPVAAPIALIGAAGEDIGEILKSVERQLASDSKEISHDEPKNVRMLPKLRKLIQDKGIDIDGLVAFCGKDRITEDDILDYEASLVIPAGERRERMSGMRRAIAGNMLESRARTAMLTNITEVDMTDCVQMLDSLKRDGEVASVTAVIVKACAQALREHGMVNSSLDGDDIVLHGEVNIGCAVDVPNGLMVPVIHNADSKDVYAVSREISDFAKRGKRLALTGADTTGGTFTVSNVGMLGVESFTPIINYPQAAILGIGSIARLPRYIDATSETPVPRHIMKLCLSYDHRIIDGAPAARFSLRVRELLEEPSGLLRRL